MPSRRSPSILVALAVLLPAVAAGQGYTLRPGTRGFDPKYNPYGVTESPQPPARPAVREPDGSKTTVTVELLLSDAAGGGLEAQRWSAAFADLGYAVRIRPPIVDDGPEVKETTRGTLRYVTAIGSLDRAGNAVFPGRKFALSDVAALKEWLDELKTYGAQGSPEGRPMWGLNRTQFEALYRDLSKPVTAPIAGLPFADALAKLPLPEAHPLRFGVEAEKALAAGGPAAVGGEVTGLTAGTALAAVLSEAGLGFRPNRTPAGAIELLVEPLPAAAPDDDAPPPLWPVGWAIEEERVSKERRVKDKAPLPPPNRVALAPGLFEPAEIGFPKTRLTDVLAAAAKASGVPVLLDRGALAAAGTDLSKLSAEQPFRRTSWNVALRSALGANRLRHEIRRDEAGHAFVRVTPLTRGR